MLTTTYGESVSWTPTCDISEPTIPMLKGRTYIVVNATTPHTWGLNSRESGIGSPEPLGKGGYVVFAVPDR